MSELRFCVRSDKRERFFLSLCVREGSWKDGKGREGGEERRRHHSLWGTIAHDRDARIKSSNTGLGHLAFSPKLKKKHIATPPEKDW